MGRDKFKNRAYEMIFTNFYSDFKFVIFSDSSEISVTGNFMFCPIIG